MTIQFLQTRLAIILLPLLVASSLNAQIEQLPHANDTAIGIESKSLQEKRTVWVHLPDNYQSSFASYPVLYLTDGEGHFNYVSQLVEYLSSYDRNRIPPMIVVAIGNIDRTRDFTPIHSLLFGGKIDSVRMATSGGGAKFLDFIQNELVPYIDTHYRTQPYRVLGAHSLGGTFAVFAKVRAPDLFKAMILMSPAIYGGNTEVLRQFALRVKSTGSPQDKMYITLGDEQRGTTNRLQTILKANPGKMDWQFQQYERENHFSVTYKSMYDGLKFIYRNWFVDNYGQTLWSVEHIRSHFRQLSKEFGYPMLPTEDFVNNAGYKQLNALAFDMAITLFKENTMNYPQSWNAWDSLGEAYAKKGDKQLAIECYQRSLLLNPGNEDGRKALERLSQ